MRRIGAMTLGTAIGVAILAMGRPPVETPAAWLHSDVDGAIREVVIHHVPSAAGITAGAYREYLAALPADVTVRVVVPDEAAFADLVERTGPVRCRLRPVVARHAMTCWSRDRWLAMEAGDRTVLVAPRVEAAAAAWPERAGDARIADDLARSLGSRVDSVRCTLAFDGGDFVADDRTVFVTPAVARRNLGGTVLDLDELRGALRRMLGRRVVLLDEAPDHHAGMFLMAAGEGRVVVGDPSLAVDLEIDADLLAEAGGPDRSPATQERFDAVARRCREEGYVVIRMPVLPARDGRTWLTPINAIVDERGGRRTVFMPVYRGAEALSRAGTEVWKSLGLDVVPVDCTATFRHFGSLRCLVSVLGRG